MKLIQREKSDQTRTFDVSYVLVDDPDNQIHLVTTDADEVARLLADQMTKPDKYCSFEFTFTTPKTCGF
jgi:hypothetical protein